MSETKKTITPPGIKTAIARASLSIQANETYLNELDAIVGDGEHGVNLSKAFRRVREKLPGLPDDNLAELLKNIGRELIAAGGGAGTTFYGTSFLAAGKLAVGVSEIDGPLLDQIMTAALEDIRRRGGANPGDKTMIDALFPAVDALHRALQDGQSIPQALLAAAQAAREGAIATKQMVGRRGRSLYSGERALNVPDPGATSAYLILCAFADTPAETPL